MKISVELPSVIVLNNRDEIHLAVGNGMDGVTVKGDGTIVVTGNGGGASSFVIDVPGVLRELENSVKPISL